MNSLTKIIALLGGGLCICLLVFILFVSPTLQDVSEINALVKAKKIELAVLEQQIIAFKTAQSDLAKATRKDDIATAIVAKEDLVTPVIELEAAAAVSGTLHILNIVEEAQKDPKTKTALAPIVAKVPGISEVTYELNISSDYNGLVNFLRYLEHLPHFTEMGAISLTGETAEAGNTGIILGTLKAVFFIKTPPSPPTSTK